MSKLTEQARGRDCMIRVPGFCSFDSSTVVACHWRDAAITGKGQRAPDILAAWGCHICHGIVDSYGASVGLDRDYVRLLHAEGIIRTQYYLLSHNIVRIAR